MVIISFDFSIRGSEPPTICSKEYPGYYPRLDDESDEVSNFLNFSHTEGRKPEREPGTEKNNIPSAASQMLHFDCTSTNALLSCSSRPIDRMKAVF